MTRYLFALALTLAACGGVSDGSVADPLKTNTPDAARAPSPEAATPAPDSGKPVPEAGTGHDSAPADAAGETSPPDSPVPPPPDAGHDAGTPPPPPDAGHDSAPPKDAGHPADAGHDSAPPPPPDTGAPVAVDLTAGMWTAGIMSGSLFIPESGSVTGFSGWSEDVVAGTSGSCQTNASSPVDIEYVPSPALAGTCVMTYVITAGASVTIYSGGAAVAPSSTTGSGTDVDPYVVTFVAAGSPSMVFASADKLYVDVMSLTEAP